MRMTGDWRALGVPIQQRIFCYPYSKEGVEGHLEQSDHQQDRGQIVLFCFIQCTTLQHSPRKASSRATAIIWGTSTSAWKFRLDLFLGSTACQKSKFTRLPSTPKSPVLDFFRVTELQQVILIISAPSFLRGTESRLVNFRRCCLQQ